MTRFREWYDGDTSQPGGGPNGGTSGDAPNITQKVIGRPSVTVSSDEPSLGVIVSREEELVGINAEGWEWLTEALGVEDDSLTGLLLAHNRQSPGQRISGQAPDAGAADLLAWLLSESEKAKDNSPRIALIPSALAQAMNERDAKRWGPPPSLK